MTSASRRFCASLFLVLLLAGCSSKQSRVADSLDAFFPSGVDSVTLFLLDPGHGANPFYHFHGHGIMSQKTSTDQEVVSKIVKQLTGSMRTKTEVTNNFRFRHGVRLQKGNRTFEMIISYDSGSLEAWDGSSHEGTFDSISMDSRALLEEMLKGP